MSRTTYFVTATFTLEADSPEDAVAKVTTYLDDASHVTIDPQGLHAVEVEDNPRAYSPDAPERLDA